MLLRSFNELDQVGLLFYRLDLASVAEAREFSLRPNGCDYMPRVLVLSIK